MKVLSLQCNSLISGNIHHKVIDPHFTVKAFSLQYIPPISGDIYQKKVIDPHFNVKAFSLQCIPLMSGDIYQKSK